MPRAIKGISKPINRYGLPESPMFGQVEYDKLAFYLDWPRERGGLGRYAHFRNLCSAWYPKIVWDEWLELKIRSLCDNEGFPGSRQWVSWTGCAGSAKTYGSALYAAIWWLVYPEISSVIMATTTGKALRRRVWPEIQNHYGGVLHGNFVDSRTTWQNTKGDDKHAIFGIAVESGPVNKAVDHIKGVHTKRQLVIVDEAQGTPEAVFEACSNLIGYPSEFQLLVIGNPWSRFDPLGKFSEPAEGWSSVHPGMEEWEGRPQMNGKATRVIRFDAERSPNVLAGKIVSKHLIDAEKLKALKEGLGEGSPRYWAEVRGFWPPEGLVKTVLTESEIARMGANGKFIFTGRRWWRVAGHDPAFGGGDRPVIWFGKVGEVEGGYLALQFEECVILKTNATLSMPINFQLAQQCIRECNARGVKPSQLAVDCTGGGRPYCDILDRDWKGATSRILREEFGGKPSNSEISAEDWRQAKETYKNRVTEMWYKVRELVLSGQLRGIDAATSIEFTSRQYDDISNAGRIALEEKAVMRARIGKSPDLGDAAVLCAAAAIRTGLSIKAVGQTVQFVEDVDKTTKAANEVYEQVDYSDANNESDVEDFVLYDEMI